ncbi:hypothetical protein [Mesorhizobium onobrychidis]|uniref:Transcriptional regulator n=1 Tax=Mesorhizobium onobrychidis TaxID=2775404 RepID=A0ABY5R7H1_9HYPH|nr:hypothetical protein [Mesorhizobium onobrychidis]UVC19425.1 hypothetical protein IHQ72_35865 [Mesorhizobium onobrychidis]
MLATGYCSSGMMQRDGASWLSTSRLFRHDIQGWRKWEPEQSGATRARVIVEDGNSNVWVGASTGLWRYVDIAKDLEFSGERLSISSVVATDSGDAVVGLQSGEVWLVRRNLTRSSLLPRDITVPVSPYYRGALLARDVSGQLWVLNANGLFKIEASGRSLKVAPFPIPLDVTPRTPAALAVSATGKACVGLVWSNEVVCLVDGAWQTAATLLEDIGGSAVGAVAFTKEDTLIAAGVLSVKMIGANTEEFGPFPPVPFGSKHLFSAVAETTLVPGADIAASGGWGGTVFLKRTGDTYVDTGYRPRSQGDQPYLIRQLVSHPQLGLLAGADEGLFIWQGPTIDGTWMSLREMDPRLAGSIEAVAPSSGRSFWVASGSRLSLLELPSANPQILFARFPEGETIAQNTVTYHLSVPDLSAFQP